MAENDIESLISAAKRKRGANCSSEEQIVLIEEVLKYENKLFGKIKGAGAKGKHGKIKEETWQSITDRLNSQFRNERTSDSISKKYDYIKQRAKDKIDGIRRPKTGGGPPPAPLTQAEEALYQAMDTRPTIVGLVGGIDTDEPLLCTKQPQEICHSIVAMEDCPTVEASGDASSSSNVEKKKRKMPQRERIEEMEIQNLNLENQKLSEEIKKLLLEQRKLEKEEKKLQTEIDVIEIKKTYMICKLNAEFSECLLDTNCI
ncbi:uncharacterized protein LOC128175629 [Crassostrea angulata]|uniref:uncharacterized protein LOC128175629 n=1 Tax=Magallana angulata TaxID=2784310 RepID=UPI0022B12315|nr:uncharacterized protein LOC128175629 [Crassostrea angulata]